MPRVGPGVVLSKKKGWGASSAPAKGRRSLPWRHDPEILLRLDAVSAMMVRGANAWQIAESLGYSLSTAKRDMTRVRKLWLEDTRDQLVRNRARSIAQIREVQRRSWQQFDSKASPRYLRLILDCEKEIASLEGTRSAVSVDVTSKGKELRGLTAEDMSDDELAAIAAKGSPGAVEPEAGPS